MFRGIGERRHCGGAARVGPRYESRSEPELAVRPEEFTPIQCADSAPARPEAAKPAHPDDRDLRGLIQCEPARDLSRFPLAFQSLMEQTLEIGLVAETPAPEAR